MQLRVAEAMGEWDKKIAGIKRKAQLAEKMANMEQGEGRSYWQYYRNMMLKRFDKMVREHNYTA